MAEVTITVNEFAPNGGEEGLKAAIVTTLVRIHAEATVRAPVDTSQLRTSLMWKKGWTNDAFNFPNQAGGGNERQIDKPSGLEGVVGTAVTHGIYQEFGTRKMKAQPYLRPAVDAVRGASASEIARQWGPEAMEREFKRRKRTIVR